MRKTLLCFLLLIIGFILMGCNVTQTIYKGNGVLKTKELNDFSKEEVYQLEIEKISLKNGSIKINFIEETDSIISIKTDENVLDELDIQIKKNVIKIIGNKKHRYDVEEFTIDICNLKFDKLELEGAFNYTDEIGNYDSTLEINITGIFNAEINLENVIESLKLKADGIVNADFQNLDVNEFNLHGNGTVNLESVGLADSLVIDANGIMNFNLKDFQVKIASINMDGTMYSSFNITEELTIDVDGFGNIDYYGNPEVESLKINGLVNISNKAK